MKKETDHVERVSNDGGLHDRVIHRITGV
jgi:hypothetical protein